MTAARVLQRGDSLIEAFGPRSTALKDRDERTSLAGRTIVGQPFPVPRPASRGTPGNCWKQLWLALLRGTATAQPAAWGADAGVAQSSGA